MIKKINEDFKYLISIWLLLIVAIIATYAHHGHLIIDCGREVYYPTQILLGKVLYKDIFNIYGPFSYMFNAVLFKIFGIHLNVLYIAGCVCSFLITSLIYLISSRFLSKFLSLAISVYTVSIGVLTLNLFNFIFPYSYAMLYGLSAFLISIWALLKYEKHEEVSEKVHYFYLSSFFAGLCITSKYEFLPYLIVIVFAAIKINRLSIKQNFLAFLSFIAASIICFGTLFLQGLKLSDLFSTLIILKTMAQSQTIKYFYHTQGVYFDAKTIPFLALNFIKTAIPFTILLLGTRFKNKFASIGLILLSLIAMPFLIDAASFVFLPILILILAVINFKNLKTNNALTILTLSAIIISIKVFWGLATLNYGLFFASYLLITLLALIDNKFKDKKINYTAVAIYILFISVILGYQNLLTLKDKQSLVQTNIGSIYTTNYLGKSTNELINYINKNTKSTDTIVVLPEGPFINFLTGRPSDNYYNSLIPLYVEVFGEDKIIEHFKKSQPEYIVFNNWNTKDYYFKYICSDYAVSFCNFVAKNYNHETTIGEGFKYLIFKKK